MNQNYRNQNPKRSGEGSYQQRIDRSGGRFLPDPEVLENYNYVIEGSGERILAMIEAEQKHRHDWENRALRTHAASQVMGIVAALIVMVGVVMCTAFLAVTGKEAVAVMVAAIGFGIVGFALLVNVLLRFAYRDTYNRNSSRNQQQQRNQTDRRDAKDGDDDKAERAEERAPRPQNQRNDRGGQRSYRGNDRR